MRKRWLSRYGDFTHENWIAHSFSGVSELQKVLRSPVSMGFAQYDALNRCPYLYDLLYRKHWSKNQINVALVTGGLFRAALAKYFTGWLNGDSLDGICRQAFELVDHFDTFFPDIVAEVRRLLTAWFTVYHGTGNSFLERVIAVDCHVSSVAGFRYAAYLDLVLETEKGGIEIMTHKTARQYTVNMLLSYRLESQFIGHMHLWETSGLAQRWGALDRYTVNLVTKTKKPVLELVKVPRSERFLKAWRFGMRDTWKLLNQYKKRMVSWPRRMGYQCRFCEAFEHCASENHSLAGWHHQEGAL